MAAQTPQKIRTLSPIAVWLLVGVVIALAIFPLLINPTSEFGGADGAASDAISEISPNTKPWINPIWAPPGGETESLLFALQAALGASVIGYFFGLKRGQRQGASQPTQPASASPSSSPSPRS